MTEKSKLIAVKNKLDSEILFSDEHQAVTKIKVDGGCIYHTRFHFKDSSSEAMCFVPEKNQELFEALEILKNLLEILISQAKELKDEA